MATKKIFPQKEAGEVGPESAPTETGSQFVERLMVLVREYIAEGDIAIWKANEGLVALGLPEIPEPRNFVVRYKGTITGSARVQALSRYEAIRNVRERGAEFPAFRWGTWDIQFDDSCFECDGDSNDPPPVTEERTAEEIKQRVAELVFQWTYVNSYYCIEGGQEFLRRLDIEPMEGRQYRVKVPKTIEYVVLALNEECAVREAKRLAAQGRGHELLDMPSDCRINDDDDDVPF